MNNEHNRYIDNLINKIREANTPTVHHVQKSIHEKALEEERKGLYDSIKESRILQENMTNWSKTVKEQLLGECINKVYSGAMYKLLGDQMNSTVAESVVGAYIREEGVDNILRRMQYRSVLLSEMYQLVNKYHTLIMEASKKEEKSKPKFKIPEDCKDSFYDELDMTDTDDVEFQISDRVSGAIDSFLNNNTMAKLSIKQILQSSQEKLQQAKTDIQRESIERVAQQDIYNARNSHPVGIFDEMVNKACKEVLLSGNTSIRETYMTEGGTKLDVDAIVDSAKYTYTLMETLNAIQIKEFSESTLLEQLKTM